MKKKLSIKIRNFWLRLNKNLLKLEKKLFNISEYKKGTLLCETYLGGSGRFLRIVNVETG